MEDQEFERNEQMLEARRLKRLEQKRRRQMQQRIVLGVLAVILILVIVLIVRGCKSGKAGQEDAVQKPAQSDTQDNTPQEPADEPDTVVTLAAVGDIMVYDEQIDAAKQSDGSYLVACSADLDDLYDLFDMKPSEEYDASSVSGWVMEEIGRVPDVGDRFRADGLEVCVTRVEHRRVMEIRVRRLPKGDAAPEKVHAHSGT